MSVITGFYSVCVCYFIQNLVYFTLYKTFKTCVFNNLTKQLLQMLDYGTFVDCLDIVISYVYLWKVVGKSLSVYVETDV